MGVMVEEIIPGDGVNFPKAGQTVVIHYVGTFSDGKKFDSSRDRGVPLKFRIGGGQVIKGWDEGVSQMSRGASSRLTITGDYGYGLKGFPGSIPPDATLIYEIELLDIM